MINNNKKHVIINTLIAAVVSIFFIMPFFLMVTVAFKTNEEYMVHPIGIPLAPTLEYVKSAWVNAELGHAMINSFIVAAIAVFVAAFFSLSSSFWFAILNNRKVDNLRQVIMLGYAFPAIIWLIPLFVIAARNGLTNKLYVLGIVYGVSNIPFGIYLMHSFFKQVLSSDIMEAASLDGASTMRKFFSIAIPLSLPALSALCALVFVWSFGDLLFAVTFLQNKSTWTLPMAALTLVSNQRTTAPAQSAAACISLIPSLLVVIFAQKALVRGFAAGGSKE